MRCPLGIVPGEAPCPSSECLFCLRAKARALLLDLAVLEQEHRCLQKVVSNDRPSIPLPRPAISAMFALSFLGAFLT